MVTSCPFESRFAVFYRQVKPLGLFESASGPTTKRQYFAFVLEGRKRGLGPIGPCANVAPR
jgi:hypothetical protein